jgi:hypothetical protein
MTRAAFIGSKQRAAATTGAEHPLCVVHTVKRSCGHLDARHDTNRFAQTTNKQLQVWRSTGCDECEGMAEQGISILNNFPVFAL